MTQLMCYRDADTSRNQCTADNKTDPIDDRNELPRADNQNGPNDEYKLTVGPEVGDQSIKKFFAAKFYFWIGNIRGIGTTPLVDERHQNEREDDGKIIPPTTNIEANDDEGGDNECCKEAYFTNSIGHELKLMKFILRMMLLGYFLWYHLEEWLFLKCGIRVDIGEVNFILFEKQVVSVYNGVVVVAVIAYAFVG